MQADQRAPDRRGSTRGVGAIGGFRRRRHGATVPFDRDELERSGWRTTLEYRENHVRRRDGRLDHLEEVWYAEAERTCADGSVLVVSATAHSSSSAWTRLRREADLATCPSRDTPGTTADTGVKPVASAGGGTGTGHDAARMTSRAGRDGAAGVVAARSGDDRRRSRGSPSGWRRHAAIT